MLATFCLRLAFGLVGALLLVSAAPLNPRFYRTHFLTVFGLTTVAAVFLQPAGGWAFVALGGGLVSGLLGALSWSLEGAPGGRPLIVLCGACLATALLLAGPAGPAREAPGWLQVADDLTAAALLGSALTAMLVGHSYLIAPGLSLTPLRRLLAALAVALLLRAAVAGLGLWFWTAGHTLLNLRDVTVFWLPLRWGLGLAAPVVLGWMAWQTARIRSTQSATGILYVVVVFCFLGELTSQLLQGNTGYGL